MWKNFLLLFFLSLLGATAAQPSSSEHLHALDWTITTDDSWDKVFKMLIYMTKYILTEDSRSLSFLFTNDFIFKGRERDYDRDNMVEMIGNITVGKTFPFEVRSSRYISADKIDFCVRISGLGSVQLEAQFFMYLEPKEKLLNGTEMACPKWLSEDFMSE
ncbi:unnamed protein product [Caenorhabditis brenneri]